MSSRYESVFAKIERAAKAAGVETELYIENSDKLSISFQMRKIHQFESSQSLCAGIRVLDSKGVAGYAYTENLADEALIEAFQMAQQNARFIASGGKVKVPARLIANNSANSGGSSGSAQTELAGLYNESRAAVSMDEKIERARVLEAMALDHDRRIQVVPGSRYAEYETEVEILSTSGVRRAQRAIAISGASSAIAAEGDERVQSSERAFTRDAKRFQPQLIAERSALKAIEKLGASQPETGLYPVVFESEALTQLMLAFSDYISARSISEKNSIFADDLGRRILSPLLSMRDDPFYEGGLASRGFDGEGAVCQVTPIVDKGVLTNFLTDSSYAAHMRLPPTASAVRSARSTLDIGISNLVIEPGTAKLPQLLGSSPKVILVTEVMGFHAGFKSGTGDFSLQAEGELWENGLKSRPIRNFVVSGNLRTLLSDVEGISNRVLAPKSNIIAPDLLIRELSIAGR